VTTTRIGFIGLGVMGSAECANLVAKSGCPVTVYDIDPGKVAALVERGATAAPSVAAVAQASDVVFLSLPGGPQVEAVVAGDGGLADHLRPGQIIVDLSTTPVGLVQQLGSRLAARGGVFIDAPVARTRQAAIDGTLSIMVGCDDPAAFGQIEPLLRCMASDVTHCGPAGAGALVKVLNNMVVFETVVALAEAITVARRSGLVKAEVLFDTFAKGSAASFALSHHGMKALLPDEHPVGVFSSQYMLKDLRYALEVGERVGVRMPGATLAASLLEETSAVGCGDNYHTAVVRVIEGA
jgi:3-hydroxyisobutyrate dehydrogenase-like beta-hydroxyacid dehydrogenase